MFMRFLQLKIKSAEISALTRLYEEKVVTSLQSASGCYGAYLVQSTEKPEEVLSLTLWASQEKSSAYERSGMFMQLVAATRPYFAESAEWRLALSKDLALEYAPDSSEPTLETFAVAEPSAGQFPAEHRHGEMFLRILSLHHKPGMLEEYKELYRSEILPTLIATPGCEYACLSTPTGETNGSISVTIWHHRSDAEAYEKKGPFKALLSRVKHTLSDLSQLQIESSGTTLPSTTSEDISIEGFRRLAGRIFQT